MNSEGPDQPAKLPCLINSFGAFQYNLQYPVILCVDSRDPDQTAKNSRTDLACPVCICYKDTFSHYGSVTILGIGTDRPVQTM